MGSVVEAALGAAFGIAAARPHAHIHGVGRWVVVLVLCPGERVTTGEQQEVAQGLSVYSPMLQCAA